MRPVACLLVLLAGLTSALAQEKDVVPVVVTAEADLASFAATGRYAIEFKHEVQEAPGAAFGLRVRLIMDGRTLAHRDHAPPRPVIDWKAGETLRYRVEGGLSSEGLENGGEIEIWLAFEDPEGKRRLPPRDVNVDDGYGLVGWMHLEPFPALDAAARVEQALAAGAALAKAGHKDEAFLAFERGLRDADEDSDKRRFRDQMVALGDFRPRALDLIETRIVLRRIEDEKRRWLRLVAGQMHDRGEYHGALRILEIIGGKIAEDARGAVIGALNAAQRSEADRQDLRHKIVDRVSDAERTEADQLVEKLGRNERAIEKARELARKGQFGTACRMLRELRFVESDAIRKEAYSTLEAVEKDWVAATPPAEAAKVKAAVEHPAFARTITRVTNQFVLIGPQVLIEGIPADSIRRFDIAAIFITDLFGRLPNPDGDRCTVYFKELWDFGGGVGGGTTIDIGNADPAAKAQRIDNGLLYHEFTHCVDDTSPVFAGHHEGLADFGAAFALESLGQKKESETAVRNALEAFRLDYLERDLEYWRIPNYGPSAGFFLSFSEAFARTKDGHDWKGWRQYFREYRTAPVKDGREPAVARGMAYYLMRAFGEKAFDELVRFRLPLDPSDRASVVREMEAFRDDDLRPFDAPDAPEAHPNSPLPRDRLEGELLRRAAGQDPGARDFAFRELGLIFDWHVIGPFKSKGVDPYAAVFPPEYELDLSKEYEGEGSILRWTVPGNRPPATLGDQGWIRFDYPYQDDSAIYALTHVSVPSDVDALAHLRGDDDLALFVDDRLIGHYEDRGRNGSSWLGWRGPAGSAPDAIRLPLRLHAGRNRVLVKIKNGGGPAGLALAFSLPNGRSIEGLTSDGLPPEPLPASRAMKWSKHFAHEFAGKAFSSRFEVGAGRFEVRQKRLVGVANDRGVAWRKYTVRPGFPKDSPSNLVWALERLSEGLDDFRATIDIETNGDGAPKLGMAFESEGRQDGLSGLTLILHPEGGGMAARLERYDRLVYATPSLKLGPAKDGLRRLVVERALGTVSVRLGDLVVFDRRPLPAIPGKRRIGWMTWGPETRIARIEIERGERPR